VFKCSMCASSTNDVWMSGDDVLCDGCFDLTQKPFGQWRTLPARPGARRAS